MTRDRSPGGQESRRESVTMETPEDVAVMIRLSQAGWGRRRIAKHLGCSHETVRRYLRQGGWSPYDTQHKRAKTLDPYQDWLKAAFFQHRGNAEVLRQELKRQHGLDVSLRTLERAVQPWRQQLQAATLATVRFETPPGHQMQADFGEITVGIAGERVAVHLCVLTLGYSRRCFVRAYRHQRQNHWLDAMEEAFRHFGGVPAEMLLDNARALVQHHDPHTSELTFNERFAAFAAYWGFRPRACRPYRARTKGKDERGVGYVKRNAIAGRTFESWEALQAHLAWWMREIADVRIHGTTGEAPLRRFQEQEATALRPLPAKPPFVAEREVVRVVHTDACVEFETNWYSVPWALLRQRVTVRQRDQRITILYAGRIVAQHPRLSGSRQRSVDPQHWQGLVPAPPEPTPPAPVPVPDLQRSLDVYAALIEEESA